MHLSFTTRHSCKEMERESCHHLYRYFKPFSCGNGYCILKCHFLCLQAQTEYACGWLCITQWKMNALWAWSLKTTQVSTSWDDGGEAPSCAGLLLISNVHQQRWVWTVSKILLQMRETEDEFNKWSFLKKEAFKLLDLANRKMLRIRWFGSITNSMDRNLSKLQEVVGDGGAWYPQSMESQRVGHNLATKQQLHPKQYLLRYPWVLYLLIPPKNFIFSTMWETEKQKIPSLD